LNNKYKEKIIEACLYIDFTCPTTGNKVIKHVTPGYDFSSGESDCSCCGSHGFILVNVTKCPECGKFHEYGLREW
jgi:hypothetical protein